jgi:cysteine desulfurase
MTQGFEVTLLSHLNKGPVSPKDLEDAIRPHTILVSIMLDNNVVGTILDKKTLAEVAHKHGVVFHTNAARRQGT